MRGMGTARWLGCGALAVGILVHADVRAQSSADKTLAVAAYDEADRLMKESKFAEACPKYAESQRLDPQLGTLLHLADCHERNGQIASAWAEWREAAELAAMRGDSRQKIAQERSAVLEPKLPRIAVLVPKPSEVAGLEVRRDGQPVGKAMWGSGMPVDPGTHEVQATAPGRKRWSTKVPAKPGETSRVEIPVLEAEPAAPLPSASAASPAATTATVGPIASADASASPKPGVLTQKNIGIGVAGLGVVSLALAAYFSVQRSNKIAERGDVCPTGVGCTHDDVVRNDALTQEARSAATAAAVTFIVGGVAVAGGLALFFTARPQSRKTSGAVWLSPSVGTSGMGLSAAGRW